MEKVRTIRLRRKTLRKLCEIGKLEKTAGAFAGWKFSSVFIGGPLIVYTLILLACWLVLLLLGGTHKVGFGAVVWVGSMSMISLVIIMVFVFATRHEKKTLEEIIGIKKQLGLSGFESFSSLYDDDEEIEIKERYYDEHGY